MPLSHGRLRPEASRAAALEVARTLLIEEGPQGVTLKAVAARVDRTHANLLHHFGSAAGLQSALAASMAERITERIGMAVLKARAGELDPRVIVDLTFDAFGEEGAGALASWAIRSGEHGALDPILTAIHRLVEKLTEGHPDYAVAIQEQTLVVVLMALGDALLDGAMARALGLPPKRARELALRALLASRRQG